MVSAAIRILLLVSFVFCGLSGSAGAGIQLEPADTLNSAVSAATSPTGQVSGVTNSAGDVADGVTGTVNDAADNLGGTVDDAAGTVNDAAGTVNDVAGSVTGGGTTSGGGGGGGDSGSSPIDSVTGSITGGLSGSSGSSSSGAGGISSSGGGSGSNSPSGGSSSSSGPGSTSNRGSARTRFDRLPRLYERLLERIEAGIRVQASISRLRALLTTASPELRAKILRLIRLEILRLERDGLTSQERAAVERLRALLDEFGASASPSHTSLRAAGSSSLAPSSGDGVQAVPAGFETRLSDDSENGGPGFVRTPLLPLPSPSSPAYWLLALLAVIASVLFLVTRSPRHLLPAPVRGLVELRASELSALALTIGLLVALGAAVVIDALLL
jgi:hypothetical protein